jgi:hypothetical protein
MLPNWNSRIFSENLHSKFHVCSTGKPGVELELIDVTEKNLSPQAEQYCVLFRGPMIPAFQQGTLTLEHEKLGTLDLFLVPTGPDSHGMCYLAVFSRLYENNGQVR